MIHNILASDVQHIELMSVYNFYFFSFYFFPEFDELISHLDFYLFLSKKFEFWCFVFSSAYLVIFSVGYCVTVFISLWFGGE